MNIDTTASIKILFAAALAIIATAVFATGISLSAGNGRQPADAGQLMVATSAGFGHNA